MAVEIQRPVSFSQRLASHLRSQDQYARKQLLPSTAAAGFSLCRAARIRQNVAHRICRASQEQRLRHVVGAVSTEQSSVTLTSLLQLQKRLESSGASLDTLDLSYRQCVAARKVRHGEVPSQMHVMHIFSLGTAHCCHLLCRRCSAFQATWLSQGKM